MIRTSQLVIFDLDGTLADTASLEQSERTPARLLAPGVNPGDSATEPQRWAWSREVSDVPAILIERGHRVMIVTNSPPSYASTLTFLIGVEHEGLYSLCGGASGKANRIKQIISDTGFQPSDVIYVGDTEADAQTAKSAGVRHMTASQLLSGEVLENLPTPQCGINTTPKIVAGVDSEEFRKELIRDERVPFYRSGSIITPEERSLFAVFSIMSEWTKNPQFELCSFLSGVLEASETDNPLAAYRRTLLYYALRTHPGLPLRSEIQEVLLRNVTEDERWDLHRVVIGDTVERFGLMPGILTRRERSSAQVHELPVSANARMFPPITNGNLSCAVNYSRDSALGKLMRDVKDYNWNPKGSGPAVRLGFMDGIADMCAGLMSATSSIPIVPVPSSPYSVNKPGQVSLRLASAISARNARPILPLIELGPSLADGSTQFRVRSDAAEFLPVGSLYDLFDDHITNGDTIYACRQLMDAAGYRLNHIYTYSAKSFQVNEQQQVPHGIETSGMHAKRWKHMCMRSNDQAPKIWI